MASAPGLTANDGDSALPSPHQHVCITRTRMQPSEGVSSVTSFDGKKLTTIRRYDTCFLKWYSESELPCT